MASGDLALALIINAKDNASAAIGGIAASLGKLAGGGVVGAVVATGAALVGIGVAAVKSAGDFQQSMTQLVTGAGEAKSNIKMVGDGILQMAGETGTSAQDLAKAMYMIESSGQHGADALKVLQVAAEGAKVGNADLTTVAKALTTVLTDYHMPATQAANAMNGLVATTAAGKMKMQDLASSMGNVLPLAASLGVSFPQVGGAIATMTNAGMSAQRSSMNLANALRSLAAPGATAQKSMKEVGLSAQDLKDTLTTKGLTGAIQLIEQHVGSTFPAGSVKAVEAFKAIMGGATGYNVALMLGGKNMATYVANVQSITKAMADNSGQVHGWSDILGDLNTQVDRVKAAFGALLIVIGSQLLPVVTPFIKGLADMISGLIGVVENIGKNQTAMTVLKMAVAALGAAFIAIAASSIPNMVLGLLELVAKFAAVSAASIATSATAATSFSTIAKLLAGSIVESTAAIAAFLGPIVLVVGGIAALAVGFKLLYDHCQPFHDLINTIAKAFGELANAVGNALKSALDAASGALSKVGDAINGVLKYLQSSKEGVNLLTAAMIGLGTAMLMAVMPAIVAFLASIPAIVAGFLAWAGAAALAAAATLAAAAPFVLIGIAVAAAVFVILEIITHWGEIAKWLQDQWQKFTDAFGGMMKKIKQNMDQSNKDWDNFGNHMVSSMKSNVDQSNKEWDQFGQHLVSSMKTNLDKSNKDWDDFGKWLSSHNYYVQDVVDAWNKNMPKIFNAIKTNLDASNKEWDQFGQHIISSTKSNLDTSNKDWDDFGKNLVQTIQKNNDAGAKSYDDFGQKMVASFQKNMNDSNQAWDQFGQGILQKTRDILNGVAGFFAGLWDNYVGPALQSFFNKVKDLWDKLIQAGKDFGKNLMNAIAQGIGDGASALGTAVHNAIGGALQAAGFHNIPGFANGVQNFSGGWAVVGERGPELLFLPSGSSVIPSGSPPPVANSSGGSGSGTDGSGQMMTIYNVIDGKVISKVMTAYMNKELRVQGAIRNA